MSVSESTAKRDHSADRCLKTAYILTRGLTKKSSLYLNEVLITESLAVQSRPTESTVDVKVILTFGFRRKLMIDKFENAY